MATAQDTPTKPLQFATTTLPVATAGNPYTAAIRVQGGEGPFEFRITKGQLPHGLILSRRGIFSGAPYETGTFRFAVSALDTTSHATAEEQCVLVVQGPLLIEWVKQPEVTENTISGSVKVTNSSARGDTFDLTVIIVAVNEVGKAFALGYQRFDLAQQVEQEIPFESTLPNGRYIVHADAIAEVAVHRAIYRARLQTRVPLVVDVNR